MVAGPLPLPMVIPLALGAALGGADALRVLLELAGRRSPFLDIAICIYAMCVATAYLLGAAASCARRGGGPARAPRRPAATDRLSQVTVTVSVGVAFPAAACLLAAPLLGASGSGGLDDGARSLFPGFPWRSGSGPVIIDTPVVVAVGVALAGTALLVGFSRGAGNGAGSGGGAATDARRFGKLTPLGVTVIVSTTLACLLAIPYAYALPRGKHACYD